MLEALIAAMFMLGAGAIPVPVVLVAPAPGMLASATCHGNWRSSSGAPEPYCPSRQALIILTPAVAARLEEPGAAGEAARGVLRHEVAHAWDLYDDGRLNGSPGVYIYSRDAGMDWGCYVAGSAEHYACESVRLGSVQR